MHSSMPMCKKGTSRVGIIVVEQRSVGRIWRYVVKSRLGTKERVHVSCDTRRSSCADRKERLGDDAHPRTRLLLKDNRSLWLKECVVQLRLCWKRKSSNSSNGIKVLRENRGSMARASRSKW